MATIQNSIKKKPQFQPLAQTFQIPTLNSPTIEPDIANFQGGAFLTSVDIFFFAKDELLPVFVEVRETINGYTGPKVLPFSRKWLKPESVNTSTLGDVSTTFTFPSPVYILEGVEYHEFVGWEDVIGEHDEGSASLTNNNLKKLADSLSQHFTVD